MKKIIILLVLVVASACQDTNSNSDDRAKYGPIVINETDPNFLAAYNVIQNRCVSCHTSSVHSHWAGLTSNADWLAAYVMTKNSPETSALVQRIINSGNASSNMPIGGSALPAAEYQAIVKWVKDMP